MRLATERKYMSVNVLKYIPNDKREGRIGDWIQVYSGKVFFPLDPRADEVDIEDIAHSLSLKCRYSGHCRDFYSVAEHSVLVSHEVSEENALWALLHDAAEAYSSDIPRPLKHCLPDWKIMEDKIMLSICEKFDLPDKEPVEVKNIDLAITSDERLAIMNPCIWDWGKLPSPLGVKIRCLVPKEAERVFMKRFEYLMSIKKIHGIHI